MEQITQQINIPAEGSMPLISVIVAVLNRAECIERLIDSIINQSYKNIELIVIDGASTDGTLEILKKYQSIISHLISEPDHGIYDAINKGVRIAKGDWINIQGSDDYLYDSLGTVAGFLMSKNTVYYGDLFYHYERKIKFGKLTHYQLANYRFGHHRFFFPRDYFLHYSYNTKFNICADYEMVVRSFCEGRYPFKYIPVVVAEYNERDGASSKIEDHQFNQYRFTFLRSHFPMPYVFTYYLRKYLADCRKTKLLRTTV